MPHPATLAINENRKSFPLGDLYGAFFEDINHAADGGLYAELVRNRSFEFDAIDNARYTHLTAWSIVKRNNGIGSLSIENSNPFSHKNPHYVVLTVESGTVGIMNEGFNRGISVVKNDTYDFSILAKKERGTGSDLHICLEGIDGTVYASTSIALTSNEWTKYECTLTSADTDHSSRLVITTKEKGIYCFDFISLFPQKTFKNRKNGLRSDIAGLIADLKPKFFRFPGGCIVHGGSLDPDARDSMYRWKNTIGPLEHRPARRSFWGYHQTLGLGYFEYFLFCEDIGAKPLPTLPAAYNPNKMEYAAIKDLGPWIDDALDLIEFANGDTNTAWGKVRAKLGHPKPFGLEYLGIGNEELFDPFLERYPYFHNAIKEKYPDIKVISSSGPFADGYDFDLMWDEANKAGADLVDEHYYMSPEWLLKHYHRYDSYQRDGAKVFLGEYASLDNKYFNALAEAAFMTGFERNADAVHLVCYAPLLCNTGYVNWKPDLIYYDNYRTMTTANYHVQKIFANNQGEYLLPSHLEGGEYITQPLPDILGGFGFGFEGVSESVTFTSIRINGKEIVHNMNHCYSKENKILPANNDQFTITKISRNQFISKYKQDLPRNFEIDFTFTKIKGTKQIKLYFGINDSDYYCWEIGGWANDMSIIGKCINSKYSELNAGRSITIKENIEYHAKLSVNGRHIFAMIDNKMYHDFTEPETIIQPLYYSSSIDETNKEIIIKAVNVKDTPINVDIKIDTRKHLASAASLLAMQEDDLAAANSFKEPNRITPTTDKITIENQKMNYQFPPYSISIFKIAYFN